MSVESLRRRTPPRAICRRCKTAPHEVRVVLAIREKLAVGSGKSITQRATSLCAPCAEAVLEQFENEVLP